MRNISSEEQSCRKRVISPRQQSVEADQQSPRVFEGLDIQKLQQEPDDEEYQLRDRFRKNTDPVQMDETTHRDS